MGWMATAKGDEIRWRARDANDYSQFWIADCRTAIDSTQYSGESTEEILATMTSSIGFVKKHKAAWIAVPAIVAVVIGVFAFTRHQTAASAHSVTLQWNPSPGATSYNVYRSTTSGVRGSPIGTSGTTTYVDRGVPNSTTFYYTVTAVRDGQESGPSNEAKAVIP